ncbi:MAG: hypothetical protein H7X95_14200, partial [Deltaproteobacteria bacterium]|nr:hypothetical protein [Deltaproteobacteria bacterium]
MVETEGTATKCVLPNPADAKKWQAVRSTVVTAKKEAKEAIPAADAGRTGGDDEPFPRRFQSDAKGFCVYRWRNEKTFPTTQDFAKINGVPDAAVVHDIDHTLRKLPKLPESVWQPLQRAFVHMARGIGPDRWQTIAAKY